MKINKESFKKYNNIFLKGRLAFIIFLMIYTFFIAFLEIVSLGSILPFIAIVNDASIFSDNKYFRVFYPLVENISNTNLVYLLGCTVLFLFSIRAIVGIHYKYVVTKFSQEAYYHIAINVFKGYLKMPYTEFTKKNTDDMRKAIVTETGFFAAIVTNILLIISESLVLLTILTVMFFSDSLATLIIIIVTVSVYILSKYFISPNISRQGQIRAESQSDLFKLLGQSFGNFKLNKVSNKCEILTKKMSNIMKIYTKSQVNFITLADIPRFIIETLGFSLIIILVLYLYKTNSGDISEYLPILVLFAVSLFRILPSYNRIISAINNINFFSYSFNIVTHELSVRQEILNNSKLTFHHNIECRNVSFSHEKKLILKNISFKINKGENVAIIGESGSGKTTLVDIIMGLVSPNKGETYIDSTKLTNHNKQYWRGEIGYIPQDIYLIDGTVRENILFDRDYSDEDVNTALKLANLSYTISLKNGLETKVGDAGVQLSGGQKQRVGIARAILSNPELLVFDEGTSALDEETERGILKDLLANNKGKTIIFITHKKSLISMFDQVISL